MNSYELSRAFTDWCFENPHKVKPIHYAIFFFAVEHCNRLGWKTNFGFPSQMVMEAIGVKNWRTYSAGLNDLVDFGFILMMEKSKNQYSSNIIAIVKKSKAPTKALDKALQSHSAKQGQSTVSINKPLNKEQGTIEPTANALVFSFEGFWTVYPKKVAKSKCKDKYQKLKQIELEAIHKTLRKWIEYKPFKDYTHPNPLTYINQKRWEDEIPTTTEKQYPKTKEQLTLESVNAQIAAMKNN